MQENANGKTDGNGRPMFKSSLEAQILHSTLIEYDGQPGAVVTYAELTKKIGTNVQSKARGQLRTARRRCLVEKGMVWEPIKGEGIKLVSEAEKPQVVAKLLEHARRTTRKAGGVVSATRYDELAPDAQVAYNTHATRTALLDRVLAASTTKLIDAAVKANHGLLAPPIAMGKLLETLK